jgi:flagellar biogenesis protein FliO
MGIFSMMQGSSNGGVRAENQPPKPTGSFFFGYLCYADRVQVNPSTPNPLEELSWFGELFFLLFAIGLMCWVAYRLWSRSSSPVMKVVARISLEARRSLYVVEVAGQYLLIGAGEGGLSTLATLEATQVKEALASAARGEKPLAVRLMELVKKSTPEPK